MTFGGRSLIAGFLTIACLTTLACGNGAPRRTRPKASTSTPGVVAEAYEGFRPCDGTRIAIAPRLSVACPRGWFARPVQKNEDEGVLINRLETEQELDFRDKNDLYAPFDDEWNIKAIVRSPTYKSVDDALRNQCRVGETTIDVFECKKRQIAGHTFTWVLAYHSNDGNCYCRFALTQSGGLEFDLSGGPGLNKTTAQKQGLRDVESILVSARIS